MPSENRSRPSRAVLLGASLGLAMALAGEASAARLSPAIPARDGVALAADVVLPDGPVARRPAVLVMTRYGRRSRMSPGALGAFAQAGVAVVLVDMRGSGASGGHVDVAFAKAERDDIPTILDWIAAQPWSNGQVVVTGTSYDANLAELAVASGHPAVKAAVPRFIDFDTYRDLAVPGGIRNEMLLREWGALTQGLDAGRPCLTDAAACASMEGLDAVDGDADFVRLRAALLDHQADWRPYQDSKGYAFYDDVVPAGDALADGFLSRQKGLDRSPVPLQLWGSWLDASTADSALEQYRRNPSAPIELFLGAWTHGGGGDVDPLHKASPEEHAAAPQIGPNFLRFAQAALTGAPSARGISYYVMGAGEWRRTTHWPPAGTTDQAWSLAQDGALATTGSRTQTADTYRVDFTATTGKSNRWTTQLGGGPVDYGDRREADQKLKTYTGPALAEPLEITGDPRAELKLSSSEPDGAVFVYLEAVAPDGRVIYLSEGEQRLSLPGSARAGEDPGAGYRRKDFSPLTPGRPIELSVPLKSLSAVIPKGYRVRLAIAGQDADTFDRYPSDGAPTLSILVGGPDGSRLVLPRPSRTK